MTVGNQLPPQRFAHAEQHLKLVLLAGQAVFLDQANRLLHEPVVVGRDSGEDARAEHAVERLDEALANFTVFDMGDRFRFEIDPLTQSEVRPLRGVLLHIGERSMQPRLKHRADAVVAELIAQATVDRERLVGAARILHVEADEVVAGIGLSHQAAHVLEAAIGIDQQAECRQLDRCVRLAHTLGLDTFEQVDVGLGVDPGLLLA